MNTPTKLTYDDKYGKDRILRNQFDMAEKINSLISFLEEKFPCKCTGYWNIIDGKCDNCGRRRVSKQNEGYSAMSDFAQKAAERAQDRAFATPSDEPCTCASFFTVRGVHKKDCPQSDEPKSPYCQNSEHRNCNKELELCTCSCHSLSTPKSDIVTPSPTLIA